jgi:hypothetical protein
MSANADSPSYITTQNYQCSLLVIKLSTDLFWVYSKYVLCPLLTTSQLILLFVAYTVCKIKSILMNRSPFNEQIAF